MDLTAFLQIICGVASCNNRCVTLIGPTLCLLFTWGVIGGDKRRETLPTRWQLLDSTWAAAPCGSVLKAPAAFGLTALEAAPIWGLKV